MIRSVNSNAIPDDCFCEIFKYIPIYDLFKNVELVSKYFNYLINKYDNSRVLKAKAVYDLKYSPKDVQNLGKKELKTIIKTYRYVKVLMILEKLFYSRFIENIEKIENSKIKENFLEFEKRGKIDWTFRNKCKFRNKFAVAHRDTLFFWKRTNSPSGGELVFQEDMGKNSIEKSELWLHPLEIKYTYDDRSVYIEDLDAVIKLALKFMPNLSKMYFDVRGDKEDCNTTLERRLRKDRFEKSISDDIKKNFDNTIELKNISTERDLSNRIDVFEIRYTANKIKKLLTLYFGHVNEDEIFSNPIEYLLDYKVENPIFKTALGFLYLKNYYEVFVKY
jgi:hypothetical protein